MQQLEVMNLHLSIAMYELNLPLAIELRLQDLKIRSGLAHVNGQNKTKLNRISMGDKATTEAITLQVNPQSPTPGAAPITAAIVWLCQVAMGAAFLF
jgi:type II secretory pathway component HofQ